MRARICVLDFAQSLWINKIVTVSSHAYYTQGSTPSPSLSRSTSVLGAGESFGLALEALTLSERLPLCLLFQEKCLEQPPPGAEVPRGLGCVWLRPAGGESLPSVCSGLEGERGPLVFLRVLPVMCETPF